MASGASQLGCLAHSQEAASLREPTDRQTDRHQAASLLRAENTSRSRYIQVPGAREAGGCLCRAGSGPVNALRTALPSPSFLRLLPSGAARPNFLRKGKPAIASGDSGGSGSLPSASSRAHDLRAEETHSSPAALPRSFLASLRTPALPSKQDLRSLSPPLPGRGFTSGVTARPRPSA